MKLFAIVSLFALSVISTELTVVNPWSETVWKSGEEAVVKVEVNEKGDGPSMGEISIDLMSGDPNDGLLVCNIATNVKKDKTNITWKVPDFPSNQDYFIRAGNADKWYFSHTFTIKGDGHTTLPSKPVPINPSDYEVVDVNDKKDYKKVKASDNSKDENNPSTKNKLEQSSNDTKSNSTTSNPSANSTESKSNSTAKKDKSSDGLSLYLSASSLITLVALTSFNS